ncbi:glycosyltransferase family 2 protein [Marilutibacter aestuarii]|uniref:glycosyltransferase family 2 protein n=1 Tax=Marilutibacter aestuarii TaxID=1706195 RepID=UPI0014771D85|nr:glycosyltransferase family A protein [Lysobacter aestuarii]
MNKLERSGDIVAALELVTELIRRVENTDPDLARIYRRTEARLLLLLEGSHRWHGQGVAIVEGSGLFQTGAESLSPTRAAPLVSLVVPCFNAEKFLQATLESIRSQTYGRFECILVDDFSKDSSASMAKAMAQSDKRFRFYQHRANGGLAASRNSGLRLARGELVAFLDSDDLLAPESIANRVAALAPLMGHGAVAGSYDFSETIAEDHSGPIKAVRLSGKPHFVDFVSTRGDCPFNANQPLIKRNVLVEMGGFPEEYPQAEDWRLWSKVLRAGYVFVSAPTIGSGYRQTSGSMIRRAPLLHVERSRGNFFRAHAPQGGDTDPVEVAYEDGFYAAAIFDKEWGYYFAQHHFTTRVFNFIGIELARLDELQVKPDYEGLRDIVLMHIPDFYSCVSGYSGKNLLGWLENGFKRYYGVTVLDEGLAQRFSRAARCLIGCVFDGVDVKAIGGRILATRRLERLPDEVVDLVFVPHKKYHTRSFELLIPKLRAAGLTFRFVDISVPYRDEEAFDPSLAEHFMSYNEFVFSRVLPKVIVCMNDWDTVVKPLVKHANSCGIPTVGIVEGVQDFLDSDTGRKRSPYREVANVFLPGNFDRKYFPETGQTLWVTGVQRLDGLGSHKESRARANRGPVVKVVVNVNFSYGVMTDRRADWLSDIQSACNECGFEMIVSQHPQDQGDLSSYNVSDRGLYDLLVDCDVLISRFSGAILESLVIGCPVVYYNGHGELVDKFFDPLGGFHAANDKRSLVSALRAAVADDPAPGTFLEQHCDITPDETRTSVDKSVDALQAIVARSTFNVEEGIRFKGLLGARLLTG